MNIAPFLLKNKLSLLKETTNKYKMKLKQSLIDNLVSSDWTREKLAEEILMARFLSGKYKAEANWLDQLADLLRDGTAYESQDRIYKEYEEAIAKNKETYREKNCNES